MIEGGGQGESNVQLSENYPGGIQSQRLLDFDLRFRVRLCFRRETENGGNQ
jgi:hypothetical protein